jgi:hypothetical protein
MSTFWEGLSGKLAEPWIAVLLTPAAAFWAAGFGAWVLTSGWDDTGERLVRWFGDLSGTEQTLLAAGALLLLTGSASVANSLVPSVLRLLEGYWPPGGRLLGRVLTRWRSARIDAADERFRALQVKRRTSQLTPAEEAELVRLDVKLRRAPALPNERLPTKLGNVLRAAEQWPRDKYGLDVAITWPRFWLVLGETAKNEISAARQRLDESVIIWIWGFLLLVWTSLSLWAVLAAALVLSFAYWRAVRLAEIYGDLLETAFDLYRIDLYKQLRLPAPYKTDDERASGEEVTAYLWRGQGSLTFTE